MKEPLHTAETIPKEILEKVDRIQLFARHKVTSVFAGEYESAFKGRGLEFEEVREYMPGDEIRSIDWNVTARTGIPHIKRFREERELTIYFAVDVSPSGEFGSSGKTKNELAAEIVSVLSLSAAINNDKTSMLLFADDVEHFIPPGKGQTHGLHMIRELLAFKPEGTGTNIKKALSFIGRIAHRPGILFILSDFYDSDWENELSVLSRKHDVLALHIYDPLEKQLPDAGLLELTDRETGETGVVDTSSKEVRKAYERNFSERINAEANLFRKWGCDYLALDSSVEYIHELSQLMLRRAP